MVSRETIKRQMFIRYFKKSEALFAFKNEGFAVICKFRKKGKHLFIWPRRTRRPYDQIHNWQKFQIFFYFFKIIRYSWHALSSTWGKIIWHLCSLFSHSVPMRLNLCNLRDHWREWLCQSCFEDLSTWLSIICTKSHILFKTAL